VLRAGGPLYYGLAPDSDIGGEVYERRLAERLPSHGVELVLGLRPGHRADKLPEGVQIDTVGPEREFHWLTAPRFYVPYVVGLLRRDRVELLRGHSVRYVGPSLLIARAIARSKTPLVLHHHHFTPRWRALEASILRRAGAVVTVSEHSRGQLIDAGVPRERVHVVPDGVDRPPPTAAPGEDDWPQPGLRLLHVGRLEPRKGPRLAIEALDELRRRGIAASLVLAGDGPQRPELEALSAQRNLGAAVRFEGRVSDARKWQLLDGAELLLFGSTLEGFGLVVAEAQSRGLPVVAARGTATSEALVDGESGLLVSPTTSSFADAVARLAEDDRRQAMAARALEFGRRFSWDSCAAGVAEVYRSLAGR